MKHPEYVELAVSKIASISAFAFRKSSIYKPFREPAIERCEKIAGHCCPDGKVRAAAARRAAARWAAPAALRSILASGASKAVAARPLIQPRMLVSKTSVSPT